ncbi:hypothetical protein F0562_032145 [Nyssa sinensis]|uniref:Uncharacterized protein n=1 Tax=Nyssa sinensis TaxID=561372 RepID=A0A5J5AXN4_9ASTE|nr:hypothetical protein F0562_032145 [Nyssa sinensis]
MLVTAVVATGEGGGAVEVVGDGVRGSGSPVGDGGDGAVGYGVDGCCGYRFEGSAGEDGGETDDDGTGCGDVWGWVWSAMMEMTVALVVLRHDGEGRWRDLVMVEMSAVEVLDVAGGDGCWCGGDRSDGGDGAWRCDGDAGTVVGCGDGVDGFGDDGDVGCRAQQNRVIERKNRVIQE